MKRNIKQIIKDVLGNLKGYEKTIDELGEDYYKYDRHNFIYSNFVEGGMDREKGGEDVYDTDVETISTQLIQMVLMNQILYSNIDNDELIDRFKSNKKETINENEMTDDKKIIESFVWYCFSRLTDEQIKSLIPLYRENVVGYYKNIMSKKLNVSSNDKDMNTHNTQKIEKDIENKQYSITTSLLQFTDGLGLSKDGWKKMLDL